MDNSSYRQPEVEINLKELIWDLLSQWKAVLLVAVIMMVLVSGAKHIKDTKAYNAAVREKEKSEQSHETAEERIAGVISALPEDEAATVEFLVNQNEWIETEKEYMNNSILMNTNPANQRTLLLDYYISMTDSEESKMTALMNGYTGYLNNEDLISNVGQVVAPDADKKYIAELISVNPLGGDNSVSEGGMIEVYVVLPDDADAVATENAMTTALSSYTSVLKQKIGDHSFVLIKSAEAYLFNNVAVSNHNSIMSSIYNLQNNAKNMQTNLSNGQKAALASITAIKKEQLEAVNNGQQGSDENDSDATERARPGFSKKYGLLGFVLGILMYAVAYTLLVIVRGRVNYANDAKHYTQARLIGEVYKEVDYKGIKKLLHSKFVNKYRYRDKTDADLQLDKLSERIEAICKHERIKDAVLMSSSKDSNKELVQKVIDKITSKGLGCRTIEIKEDVEEKPLLSASHALLVMDSDAKVVDVTKLLGLCKDYDVKTIGSVFVGTI